MPKLGFYVILTISCLVAVGVLFPTAAYLLQADKYEPIIASYKDQLHTKDVRINDLEEQINELTDDKANLIDPNRPYLVTRLGWYLHNSTDPVKGMRNTFTIYGTITNIGANNATDVKLLITFYDGKTVLNQVTKPIYSNTYGTNHGISTATIEGWSSIDIGTFNIQVDSADDVTAVVVTPQWL